MTLLEDRTDQQDQHEVAEQVLPALVPEDVREQADVAADRAEWGDATNHEAERPSRLARA